MTLLLALLALLAGCGSDPPDTDGDTDVPDDTDDTDVASAAFAEPPAADDLDPDPDAVHVSLTMAPLGDGGLAFDGSIPGPTIRLVLGQTITVDLENRLGEPTTVHWHGLSVPFAADGVTWMQDPIEDGETRTVSFTPDRAGTFWYHPHFDNGLGQVSHGLFGAFVVEDPAEPPADVDAVLVLDQGPGEEGEDAHAAHEGPFFVNRILDPEWVLPAGAVVRARLLNASEGGYADLRSMAGTWIAGDQGLFAESRVPADGLVLAPGDRAEVVWTVGGSFEVTPEPYSMHGGPAYGHAERLLHVASEPATAPDLPAFAFTGAAPTPDTDEAPDVVWVFSGDGDEWFMNGEQFPDVTIPELALGQTAILEIRNLSPTEHPFHLHGMPFEVLSRDGVPPPAQEIEDTVNVPIRGIVRLKVVANNPGDWMAHCHILPHAHGGMMSILRVNP